MPTATEALRNYRAQTWPGQLQDEPGLQQPSIDPVMILASLLGPAFLKGLQGLAQGAEKAAVSVIPKTVPYMDQFEREFPHGHPLRDWMTKPLEGIRESVFHEDVQSFMNRGMSMREAAPKVMSQYQNMGWMGLRDYLNKRIISSVRDFRKTL